MCVRAVGWGNGESVADSEKHDRRTVVVYAAKVLLTERIRNINVASNYHCLGQAASVALPGIELEPLPPWAGLKVQLCPC
jgi:hypothetical protein